MTFKKMVSKLKMYNNFIDKTGYGRVSIWNNRLKVKIYLKKNEKCYSIVKCLNNILMYVNFVRV